MGSALSIFRFPRSCSNVKGLWEEQRQSRGKKDHDDYRRWAEKLLAFQRLFWSAQIPQSDEVVKEVFHLDRGNVAPRLLQSLPLIYAPKSRRAIRSALPFVIAFGTSGDSIIAFLSLTQGSPAPLQSSNQTQTQNQNHDLPQNIQLIFARSYNWRRPPSGLLLDPTLEAPQPPGVIGQEAAVSLMLSWLSQGHELRLIARPQFCREAKAFLLGEENQLILAHYRGVNMPFDVAVEFEPERGGEGRGERIQATTVQSWIHGSSLPISGSKLCSKPDARQDMRYLRMLFSQVVPSM